MITYTANAGTALGVPSTATADHDGAGNAGAATWQPWSLPVEGEGEPTTAEGQAVVGRDEWPVGWLDRAFGCLSDAGLERQPQGDYEERDELG